MHFNNYYIFFTGISFYLILLLPFYFVILPKCMREFEEFPKILQNCLCTETKHLINMNNSVGIQKDLVK